MNNKYVGMALLVAGSLMATISSQAALDVAAAAVFTDAATTITDIATALWPIVAAVMGLFITIRLVRKGGSQVK